MFVNNKRLFVKNPTIFIIKVILPKNTKINVKIKIIPAKNPEIQLINKLKIGILLKNTAVIGNKKMDALIVIPIVLIIFFSV